MICRSRRRWRMSLGRERQQLLAFQPHRARGGLDQPQHRLGGGRLAAARFADQRQRLAARDRRTRRRRPPGSAAAPAPSQRLAARCSACVRFAHLRAAASRVSRRRDARVQPRLGDAVFLDGEAGDARGRRRAASSAGCLAAAARLRRSAQRGAKAQPRPSSCGAGTMPGSRPGARLRVFSAGIDGHQRARVGMQRPVEQVAAPSLPRPCGRRTSPPRGRSSRRPRRGRA